MSFFLYRLALPEAGERRAILRSRFSDSLKVAMKAQDKCGMSTLRLILAALKDRDIAARGKGNGEGIDDDEVLAMLQSMIKQRRESIALYEKGGRLDLSEREAEEIVIIERFLPAQMEDDEIAAAVRAVIDELEAAILKDMGRTMAALKERYAGRMEFSKASAIVKQHLG